MLKMIKTYRLTVYIPQELFEAYMLAIRDHIPSFGGDYDRVAWWSKASTEHGTEQFRPLEGSSPALGSIGQTVRADSVRLELTLPHDRSTLEDFLANVIIPHHPWEKPAIIVHEAQIASLT